MTHCLTLKNGTPRAAWCDSVRGHGLSIDVRPMASGRFGYQPNEQLNQASVHSEGWDM